MSFTIMQLPKFADERGNLTVLQNILPFEIARIYWIYGANSSLRGGHRHYKTRQALVSVNGCVSIYMNDGFHEETIELTDPSTCLIFEPKDWHTMQFDNDSVLLVFSSEPYDRNDYIDTPYVLNKND